MLGLAVFGGLPGLQAGSRPARSGTWPGSALGAVVVLIGGGWALAHWKKARDRYYDPQLVKEKISRGAFQAEVELVAVLPPGSQRGSGRAAELLERSPIGLPPL